MTANTCKSRKAKARTLQNAIAEDIRAAYPVLDGTDVHPAIMGQSGIDILMSNHARQFFPFAIECKNQEALNVWDGLQQAEANGAKERLTPLLVFKRNRSETYVALRWEDFMKLQKAVKL